MEILENREAWTANFRERWLPDYETNGKLDWKLYKYAKNTTAPAGQAVDLRNCRLMFITTAGAYLRDDQPPFDAKHDLGDYSIRRLPTATDLDRIAYAHEHYDHAPVSTDPHVLMPMRELEERVAVGRIGALTPSCISFMGYQPDLSRVIDEMLPEIRNVVREEAADAVLLVPA